MTFIFNPLLFFISIFNVLKKFNLPIHTYNSAIIKQKRDVERKSKHKRPKYIWDKELGN